MSRRAARRARAQRRAREIAERRPVEIAERQAEKGENGGGNVDEAARPRQGTGGATDTIEQQEGPSLFHSPTAMLPIADRRRLGRLGDGPAQAADAIGIDAVAPRHVDGGNHAAAGGMAELGEPLFADDLAQPGLATHRVERVEQSQATFRRGVEQGRRTLARHGDLPACERTIEPATGEPSLHVEAIADGLLPVIGADQEQDLVACRSQALDRLDHGADRALRLTQRLEMGGRAERRPVKRKVRVGEPRHRKSGATVGELRAETLRHGSIAGEIMRDSERVGAFDRNATRRKGAGPVVDKAEMLGIEEIRRARRNVGEGDEAAGMSDALGQCRDAQRAAGGATHMRAKIRRPDVTDDDPARFEEPHPVAVETMAARMAAGGDRRGGDPRDRREHRPVLRAPQAASGDLVKPRHEGLYHPIAPQPVATDEDNAPRRGHGLAGRDGTCAGPGLGLDHMCR